MPWILNLLGVAKRGQQEKYNEHLVELSARVKLTNVVLRWLLEYKEQVSADNLKVLEELKLHIKEYRMLRRQLRERIKTHEGSIEHDELSEINSEICLLSQIIEIERTELLRLWRLGKINLAVRNKLLDRLDHRSKHLAS